MTTKPRRPAASRTDNDPAGTISTPVPEPVETTTTPSPAGPAPVDRLEILNDYAGPDGLVPVVVVVAHDAVFVGQHLRVPVTDRVAGLIEIGFLDVDPPDPGTRR